MLQIPGYHLRRRWRGAGLAALLASFSVAAQPPTAPFPAVDSATQKARDKDRQRILLAELAAEQQALAEAQQRLAALQASPPPGDQLGAAQASVVTHRRNIEAINSELTRLPGFRRAEQIGAKAKPVLLHREEGATQPTVESPFAPVVPAAPWWDVYARHRAPRR